jgi:crossover junction endodeoxyribonuclease RuvC
MVVLGLDPGIDRLGWAVIEDTSESYSLHNYGLISTNKTEDSALRLNEIAVDLIGLIEKYSPDAVFIEKLFFSVNVKTAMTVSEVRGVIKATCAGKGKQVFEVHPLTLKKKIVGTAKATKKEIQSAMLSLFKIDTKFITDDVADAIAIAYLGILDALHQI